MAPSSLKKMSGIRRMKEGNYASLEETLCCASVNGDLGLTLLPGSQIRRKDEKALRTAAAESSLKRKGSQYVDKSQQLPALEAEIGAKYSIQRISFPNEAKDPSSSPTPGSGLAIFSAVRADINRERPFSQVLVIKNDSSAVQHNTTSADAAPYTQQQMGTGEVGNAKSCPHDNYSSRVVSWRRSEVRSSNVFRDSNVSRGKEVAFGPYTFDVDCDENLSENDAIHPGKRKKSLAVIGLPLNGTGRGSESSKPELHRQTTRSLGLDVAPARDHQSTTTFQENPPSIHSFASGSTAKHRNSKKRKLTLQYQAPNLSSLEPESRVEIRGQVLKWRKGVNTSWTSHFPAKARFSGRAYFAASSFLAVSFSPNQNYQHPLTCSNFHTHDNLSNTTLSSSLSDHPALSKTFDYPLDIYALDRILNTTHTGNRHQSTPRHSASMPNLWSTRTLPKMNPSNNFKPASMPTPPREQQTFSLHPGLNVSETTTAHDMSSPSIASDSTMPAGQLQHHRQPLEIKPNYSRDEVKYLIFNCMKQTQNLKVEMSGLQSSNIALKQGMECLQSERAERIKQIQHYERTVAQKDQQIEAMRQKAVSAQHQYRQMLENHYRLLTSLRKDSGISNPSAIAQRIRQGHAPKTGGLASQCNQPSANASPVYFANSAQISMSKDELLQIPTGPQCEGQPLSVPGWSEIDPNDASSRSLGYAVNHNPAELLQTGPIPAYPEANLANASSWNSVQPSFAAENQNSARPPHNLSSTYIQSHPPFGAHVGAMTNSIHNNHSIGQVSKERVIIDLTDESQLPSSAASYDTSVHQTTQSSVQSEYSPLNALPSQYPSANYGAANCVPSQYPTEASVQNQSSQGQLLTSQDSESTDREAMEIQKEAFARMAEKPLSWLHGVNPFRKGTITEQQTGLPIARRYSQGSPEVPVSFTRSPGVGSVAPLPDTARNRQSKQEASKKAKVVLTAESKRERARVYRKTAADKKKRDKEAAAQMQPGKNPLTNAMRAQKQDRRANKLDNRQEQVQRPLGEVGPRAPQRTLDGQLYQGDTDVQQASHQGSMELAPSDDLDSLFGDDEDNQMETEDSDASPEADNAMHEDDAVVEDGVDAAYAAELEAQLLADEDDATWMGSEQDGTHGGDAENLDGPYESEESEEE